MTLIDACKPFFELMGGIWFLIPEPIQALILAAFGLSVFLGILALVNR